MVRSCHRLPVLNQEFFSQKYPHVNFNPNSTYTKSALETQWLCMSKLASPNNTLCSPQITFAILLESYTALYNTVLKLRAKTKDTAWMSKATIRFNRNEAMRSPRIGQCAHDLELIENELVKIELGMLQWVGCCVLVCQCLLTSLIIGVQQGWVEPS